MHGTTTRSGQTHCGTSTWTLPTSALGVMTAGHPACIRYRFLLASKSFCLRRRYHHASTWAKPCCELVRSQVEILYAQREASILSCHVVSCSGARSSCCLQQTPVSTSPITMVHVQEYAVVPQEYKFGVKLMPLLPALDLDAGELAARQWLQMRS